MSATKALLFDFDGVLINSLPVMELAFSAALDEIYEGTRQDHDILFAQYQTFLGMGFPEIMNQMGLSQDMFAPFRQHSRHLAAYVRPYSGAVDLLRWAADQDLILGIATGKDEERTLELLDRLGIRDLFAAVLCSDNVPNPKPAPDMAIHFAQATGMTPAEVVFIGDATADILCGQQAGCQTAAATWGYTPHDTLVALKPDMIFATPDDARHQLGQRIIERGPE